MGNRFKNLPGYHSIIRAHGALAAITFLGLVPISILLARFYSRSPYWAIRLHIWMQILTLFLTTVVFTLGWFAVGPKRSLTNPHHGIGLAIYVMVIAQTFWGWVIHGRVKGKRRLHLSLELMVCLTNRPAINLYLRGQSANRYDFYLLRSRSITGLGAP